MENKELRMLKEAVSISPSNVPLRVHYLQQLLGKEVEKKTILEECSQLLKVGKNDAKALLCAGEAFLKLEQYQRAAACFSAVLGVPHISLAQKREAYQKLGDSYLQLDKTEKALEVWERAKGIVFPGEKNEASKAELGEADFQEERECLDEEGESRFLSLSSGTAQTTVNAIPFERSEVSFDNVGGLEKLKEQLRLKIILPFQKPDLYRIYGKKAGGGILLYGPPGCGKTLMAKAAAGECQANFVSIGISDILDMWHGNTEKNIRALFEKARGNTPCILFFDEVEAIGGNRKDMHEHFQRIITDELLTQMDGIGSQNESVLVIGATNAPWNIDNALKRPGRFDRIFFVPPPDFEARVAILKICLADKPVEKIDLAKIAKHTECFSGADLKNLVEMSAERVLQRVMKEDRIIQIRTKEILDCLSECKPSTIEWFETARNYALYANQSGFYDDVTNFLQQYPEVTRGL